MIETMIYINYPNHEEPDKPWLAKAQALTDLLKAAPDKISRDKIIDDNSRVWGEVKDWLGHFSNHKCWFTEARDTGSYWQVEHFRPKKEAKDPERDGYWWLAFDYRNYRLCGSIVNTKKGSFFPLRAETSAANGPDDNCDDEAPLLIDPTEEKDVMLLTFAEDGRAVPAEQHGWQRERAEKSIERYKLNDYPMLSRARADVWARCQLDADELKTLMADQNRKYSPSREQKIRDIVKRLKDRTRPTSEFSSVARAFLSQHPCKWASRCIT
jgi:hypothetical protein